MKLAKAVDQTANRFLDIPIFVRIRNVPASTSTLVTLEGRLYKALEKIGYARANISGFWVHPSAMKYFKEFGEEYILMLEATDRLVGPLKINAESS